VATPQRPEVEREKRMALMKLLVRKFEEGKIKIDP
jgi:hypothetical protein